nr:unnamed protein product [Spirometra erinaceieuropaei]
MTSLRCTKAALRSDPSCRSKGTPKYGLTKWLFWRLKFLTAESDTTVSSSAQFLEKLKGLSSHPNDVMVSFDVTSLCTSIPHDLAIEILEVILQNKYDETENRLGRAQVLQFLKCCLRRYFTFNGTIYEQVKGTPMGSPISGFNAEAVLQRLESLDFQHPRPQFWARYVNDSFVVIERAQVLTFKEHLNAVFPDIQFTMEEEKNNQLAFLDVLECRKPPRDDSEHRWHIRCGFAVFACVSSSAPSSSSSFAATTAAQATISPITNPGTTSDTTPTTFDSSDEDQDYTCLHCDRTFTSHIGLVGHLRINRTEAGEPVPGAPTYTHCTRLHCPHCPLTFTHLMDLFGHMRIHDDLR